MRPPLGLRPPGGLMHAPQVADFYAAAWPVFAPPLTVKIDIRTICGFICVESE